MSVAEVLGVLGFFLGLSQAATSVYRWYREPSFWVIRATFTGTQQNGLLILDRGSIILIAIGGARFRMITDWQVMAGEGGKYGGWRAEVDREPIPVPANEHRKITFAVSPAAGVSPDAQVCTALLTLRLSTRVVVRIPFDLQRMPGADQFDLPGSLNSWDWGSGQYWGRHPRWAKIKYAIRARLQ
jgi:hypothetical protein